MEMWWLIGGGVVAHWWRFGGSMAGDVIVHLVKMWWLICRICWSNDECFFEQECCDSDSGFESGVLGCSRIIFR